MILVDSEHWYADDGNLTKTFCEQAEDNTRFDPEDCCACDEAKYKVPIFVLRFHSLSSFVVLDDL